MSENATQNVNNSLFVNRVYGVQVIKSKNSNYNADFTGSPRTLPDGTVYSTDKVNKFNIRRYLGRNDSSIIFTKTTYKDDLKPMMLKDVYEHHFGDIGKDKKNALTNLLSKLDIRLFGATFAPKGAENMNISIHGPVQISYGINRFEAMKDSGMFTDQIGSPYASKDGADQSTLGSQTRSQEAHYVHHFSLNPKNLSGYMEQFYLATISDIANCKKISKKKPTLDKDKVKKLQQLFSSDDNKKLKNELIEKTQGLEDEEGIKKFQGLLREKEKAIKNAFFKEYHGLSIDDVQLLKEAMAVATTYYDSTSKKDSENELLLWIELKESSEKVLKNFTDLIKIKNNKILIKDVIDNYISNHSEAISKIELAYDKFNTSIDLDTNNNAGNFNYIVIKANKTQEDYKKILSQQDSGIDNTKIPFIVYEDLNLIKSVYESLNQSENQE